ncbi:response regulator transcription factor [Aliiroseovarius sp. F47248L]|uniref:response regulator n=1 Tax=Aliiroseovarius sp. F47248L TaxID=2926420 RepID=UPI001FF20DF7|nr:response regulator transcription factor [Aliiroseovarius sp. F47248L]MCK0140064.1 response regulator transcription factor [Aliiroseovarius sp. F47248L]
MAPAQPIHRPALKEVLVVDDHPLFCEALSMTLRSALSVPEVIMANNLTEAFGLMKGRDAPDIVLLDLNLPDVDGLDGLVRLKSAIPDTPVIVVSSLSDSAIITSVLGAGASGFIPKDSDKGMITEAFRQIRDGGIYTPADYIEPVDNGGTDTNDASARLASLTPQQACILRLICEGKLNKQIAYDLSIAETTVKAHMTAILRKLGVHSRTQAVLVAQKAKFDTIANSDKVV